MGALKLSGLPDYAFTLYFSLDFSWAFVPIDPMNVRTKFEDRSFTRFLVNSMAHKKYRAVPGYAHTRYSKKIL